MARPPLPLGERGRITRQQVKPGLWEARLRYRDATGKTRHARARGESGAKAEAAALKRVKQATMFTRDEISPDMRLSKLADLWLEGRRARAEVKPQTIDRYASLIARHIKPRLGSLRLRELTTGRVDRFASALGAAVPGQVHAACVILRAMMALAARHEAIQANPVRDLSAPTKPKSSKAVVALTVAQAHTLSERLERWQNYQDPETGQPVRKVGHTRNRSLLDVVDLMLGTGLRVGEALAVRWQDLDLAAKRPTLAVTGTVTEARGLGCHRQDHPKTDHGARLVALPPFTVAMLLRRKVEAPANALDLVFPSASGGVWSTHNFHRLWRQVRPQLALDVDLDFEAGLVTPRAFRKTVATLIDQEQDDKTAAAQLGHAGTAVTRRHYIKRAPTVTDASEILQALGRRNASASA
ncbi:MAG: site-specific integrase [Bifidobacteriaceae bacterium]|jgi:integrase|nr:site-specific integrase [Bifidobacteriaceae bacterium]